MTCTDHPLPAPTAARSDDSTLFAALELSRKSWLVATNAPGEEKVSKRTIAAGDGRALLDRLAGLREKADRQAGQGGGHPGGRRVLAAPPAGGQRH
jgi:transposase